MSTKLSTHDYSSPQEFYDVSRDLPSDLDVRSDMHQSCVCWLCCWLFAAYEYGCQPWLNAGLVLLQQDMQLFFNNMILYNGIKAPFGVLAERVRKVFERKWAATPFGSGTRARRASGGHPAHVTVELILYRCV